MVTQALEPVVISSFSLLVGPGFDPGTWCLWGVCPAISTRCSKKKKKLSHGECNLKIICPKACLCVDFYCRYMFKLLPYEVQPLNELPNDSAMWIQLDVDGKDNVGITVK